jgi:voltage-gated potassium channel Kch
MGDGVIDFREGHGEPVQRRMDIPHPNRGSRSEWNNRCFRAAARTTTAGASACTVTWPSNATKRSSPNGIAPTVIELNMEVVRALREDGIDAIYGDATRPETLAAGVARAGILILGARPQWRIARR